MPKLLNMTFYIIPKLDKKFYSEDGSYSFASVNTFWSSLCFIVWILDNSLVFNFNISILEKYLSAIKKLQEMVPTAKLWLTSLSWKRDTFALSSHDLIWVSFLLMGFSHLKRLFWKQNISLKLKILRYLKSLRALVTANIFTWSLT